MNKNIETNRQGGGKFRYILFERSLSISVNLKKLQTVNFFTGVDIINIIHVVYFWKKSVIKREHHKINVLLV